MSTYYVSSSGSDSNNGETLETAWFTLEHALDEAPIHSDIMFLDEDGLITNVSQKVMPTRIATTL